jgi:hypothetical protein
MTQDEIYEMVQQSDLGFLLGDNWMLQHELEFFAKLIADKERENCAKLLESRKTGANELMDAVRDMESKAIRARGEA